MCSQIYKRNTKTTVENNPNKTLYIYNIIIRLEILGKTKRISFNTHSKTFNLTNPVWFK